MRGSIVRRVVGSHVAVLAASLLAAGLLTGAGLHLREARSLDRALVAAAHARAGGQGERVIDPSGIETWLARPGERIPPKLYARVLQNGEPLLKDMGDDRLLLLPVGQDMVAALAPGVTLAESIGPFALVWLVTSALVLGLATATTQATVKLALSPLSRASREVERVVALGQGQRVSNEAPLELRPLLEAVNALLDRLERAHALQVRFASEAAHELRTPVTALLGELEVALRRERSPEAMREVLVSASEDVDRLRRLVEALSALARVDSGEVEAHREPARASELAEAALHTERLALESSACRVRVHLDEDPELEVHPLLLELALANLLRNAARHAPGSEVTLTVRTSEEHARFEVRDDGPGVEPGLEERLFERFARGKGGGMGLGLALAREVARRHGGDCTLHGLPGGGTRAVLAVRRP